jgi:phosphoserine phosphatase
VKELKQHKQYWKGISYAFGDRVTDGEMLREVKKPIALNPDERMKRYAKRKGWGIAKGTQILRRIRKR